MTQVTIHVTILYYEIMKGFFYIRSIEGIIIFCVLGSSLCSLILAWKWHEAVVLNWCFQIQPKSINTLVMGQNLTGHGLAKGA